jgi:uncharacterized SAM-binding protein YcdF (DUF218 family)
VFVLSKLVWIFGQPLSLAFFCVLLALIAGLLRWRVVSTLGATGAVLILFVTLYTTTGTYMLQGLEERFRKPAGDPDDVKCMIVLGGAFEGEVNTVRHGIEFSVAADRFIEALRLAQKFPQSRILVSGGDGSLSGGYEGDAAASRRFFPLFGVGVERLVEETQSRTTYENAVNTREFLAAKGFSNCLLITSGFHMPRSVGLFRKLDIDIVPWPTDYRTAGNVTLGLNLTQPSLNTQNLGTALREWYGLVGYYLAGRTSALFPG